MNVSRIRPSKDRNQNAGKLQHTVKGEPGEEKNIAADLLFDNQFYLFNLQCGPLIFEIRMKITLNRARNNFHFILFLANFNGPLFFRLNVPFQV